METLLWAIDLMLVAGFCFWAIREDTPSQPDKLLGNKQVTAMEGDKQAGDGDHA